jgi:SAM-dependent methyltransferase
LGRPRLRSLGGGGEAFRAALSTEDSPEALEELGWSAWWLDNGEVVSQSRERAYRLYRARGDRAAAARIATWLASDALDFHAAVSVAAGWLQRGHRLLDPLEPGPEHGWLAFHEGFVARLRNDARTAIALGRKAAECGRGLGIPDLEMLGLALEGSTLVDQAKLAEGMRCLDEAGAAALAGDSEIPMSGAWTCCFLVSACAAVRDCERAAEWCDRIADFADRYGSRYMPAFCRAEYGEVNLWRGRWSEAEELLASSLGDERSGAKAVARSVWGRGDYHRFAKETVWEIGPRLVRACRISGGQRVLDVAAGSGNVALRAAEVGADVVASDLAPENLEAGRPEASTRGLELEWVEADVEKLPFADGSFDAVTSSFGAIFAPDQEAAAREMLRVCRPGGVIGMANFTAEGLAGRVFGFLAPYFPPPPPGALPPLLWGDERHVRELLGDEVETLDITRETYVERAASPEAYCRLFRETFRPVIAITESLADRPERLEQFDRGFLQFAVGSNRGDAGGPAEYEYEYLQVVARRRR